MNRVPSHPARAGRALAAALVLALLASCGGEPSRSAEEDAGTPGADSPGAPAQGPDASDPPSTEPAGPIAPSTWAYTCPDGLRFTVHYRSDQATLDLPARQLDLPRTPSASGARFQSADTVFQDEGGDALLEIGTERREGCRGRRGASPQDAARLLGFDFRAVGQEPGWLVDVDLDRTLRWVGDYGFVRFATPAPQVVDEGDGTRTWRSSTDAHTLSVRVVDEPCFDAMSGEPFTHTVTVEVDGATLDGCGRWLGEERAGPGGAAGP